MNKQIEKSVEGFRKKFGTNLWQENKMGGIGGWVTCDKDVNLSGTTFRKKVIVFALESISFNEEVNIYGGIEIV